MQYKIAELRKFNRTNASQKKEEGKPSSKSFAQLLLIALFYYYLRQVCYTLVKPNYFFLLAFYNLNQSIMVLCVLGVSLFLHRRFRSQSFASCRPNCLYYVRQGVYRNISVYIIFPENITQFFILCSGQVCVLFFHTAHHRLTYAKMLSQLTLEHITMFHSE